MFNILASMFGTQGKGKKNPMGGTRGYSLVAVFARYVESTVFKGVEDDTCCVYIKATMTCH